MKRISNNELLNYYIAKNSIENMFDKELLKEMQLHFYGKDETILKAETSLEYYYLLVDGKIKISYPFENGKSMLLKFYNDFNTIGDMELLKNVPIKCDIDAVEDTYLIGISSEFLRKVCMDNPRFLRHLAEALSEKLCATINNSSYNFVYPLINRLSSYIIEHLSNENYIILNSSFIEIAQFLGTTYRHLNRTIRELEAKGIIRCEGKTIFILDEGRLRELSKNAYFKSL